jgi:deoxyhypusine monooxygenase
LATDEAVGLMCECFNDKFTPLFKHEVAFVLGQMAKTASKALTKLEQVLQDENENSIVRHETALALGEIAEGKELLEKYSTHKDQLVAESCIIATEFVDFWKDCC